MQKKLLRQNMWVNLIDKVKIWKFTFDRSKVFRFKEPSLYTLIKYSDYLVNRESYKAVSLIINISEKYFKTHNPDWILDWITKQLFSVRKKKFPKSPWDVHSKKSWFETIVDFLANRYWQNPIDIMKSISLTQMWCLIDWAVWNENEKTKEWKKKNQDKLDQDDFDKNKEKYLEQVKQFRKKKNGR